MRPNSRFFQSEYGFDFDFPQFCSVKCSQIFTVSLVWPVETCRVEKSRGCRGRFFVFFVLFASI